jgi:transposase InsO family protein
MPWGRRVEEQREQFLREFLAGVESRSAVCRRNRISRKTAYKWLKRYQAAGLEGLKDRSRRPQASPRRTAPEVEQRILELRDQYHWGGRKLHDLLVGEGREGVPPASTITEVLRRHGRVLREDSEKRERYVRFERERPNELWQMDHKGEFELGNGAKCHALPIVDDHSRYLVGLYACEDRRGETVRQALTGTFRENGLPEAMLMDNGSPWGNDREHVHTPLTAWLIRLEIQVIHGRAYHPQTQGKEERFNRTLGEDVLRWRRFGDHQEAQTGFDEYRPVYNEVRPHEALGMARPISRWKASERSFPEELPPIEYDEGDVVRRVGYGGWISWDGKRYRLAKAFRGYPVALRASSEDGITSVYFCHQRIAKIDLREGRARPVRG